MHSKFSTFKLQSERKKERNNTMLKERFKKRIRVSLAENIIEMMIDSALRQVISFQFLLSSKRKLMEIIYKK